MTAALVLDIGEVRIDAVGQPEDAERIEATLRQGLEQLAEKLASSPFGRDPAAMGVALSQLQIDSLSKEDWLDTRGATRVADILYRAIAAGGSANGG